MTCTFWKGGSREDHFLNWTHKEQTNFSKYNAFYLRDDHGFFSICNSFSFSNFMVNMCRLLESGRIKFSKLNIHYAQHIFLFYSYVWSSRTGNATVIKELIGYTKGSTEKRKCINVNDLSFRRSSWVYFMLSIRSICDVLLHASFCYCCCRSNGTRVRIELKIDFKTALNDNPVIPTRKKW